MKRRRLGVYFFNENSVVVIINVCDGFFHYHDALENAKEVGAKVIYISQDYNKEVADKVDIFYRYGVEWSINTGYCITVFILVSYWKNYVFVIFRQIIYNDVSSLKKYNPNTKL